jgi:hypothetical protein
MLFLLLRFGWCKFMEIYVDMIQTINEIKIEKNSWETGTNLTGNLIMKFLIQFRSSNL